MSNSEINPSKKLIPVSVVGARNIPGCRVPLMRCVRCGLPETYETIEFDSDGVCSICKQHDYKVEQIDWDARKKELDDLIKSHRDRFNYDAIVPFSGGKDSTWTLLYLMKEYKIRPLVVQFDHGFMRPNLLENNEKTFRKLGVAVHTFRPNWKVVKRVMLESLIRKGDFCWHCHTGIFSYPMWVAIKESTPLVIWGEPSSEYTSYYDYRDNEVESVDETRFNRVTNLGITAEDMLGMIKTDSKFDSRDLLPFQYPPRRDLAKLGYRSVCLGSFIPWNARTQSAAIKQELDWNGDEVEGMPEGLYDHEKIECWMQGCRDYIKFLKRGYSRVSQMTALDVRNGVMKKDEADLLVEQFDGRKPASLTLLLEYLDLSEDEFNTIVKKTVVAPHEPDFLSIQPAKAPKDFGRWSREKK